MVVQFIRDLLSLTTNSEKVKIDSKGRISIPGYVRRNFGLEKGSEVELRFNLKRNLILIVFENGQMGLNPIPGSDSKEKKEVNYD